MWKKIVSILIVLILGSAVVFFVFKSEPKLNPNFETESSFFKNSSFRLGLDLSGGSHLIYKADLTGVTDIEKATAMIGQTPLLEFKVEAPAGTPQKATVDKDGKVTLNTEPQFVSTELRSEERRVGKEC